MNKEEFSQWITSNATKSVFDKIREYRQSYEYALTSGQTLFHESDKTQAETARVIGVINGIDLLLEIKFEENKND